MEDYDDVSDYQPDGMDEEEDGDDIRVGKQQDKPSVKLSRRSLRAEQRNRKEMALVKKYGPAPAALIACNPLDVDLLRRDGRDEAREAPPAKTIPPSGFKDAKLRGWRMGCYSSSVRVVVRQEVIRRRDIVEQECARRGMILRRPFKMWDQKVIDDMVRHCTRLISRLFGWESRLVEEIMEDISRTNVNNDNKKLARSKKKAKSSMATDTQASDASAKSGVLRKQEVGSS